MSHQSLNRRGYVLHKSKITAEEDKKIKKDLCFEPIVLHAFKPLARPKRFYTMLESDLRYYIPRYYGQQQFGPPVKNNLLRDVEARDYTVFWDLLPHQKPIWAKIEKRFIKEKEGGILSIPCGAGKCLGKDTPVMMFDGTFKMSQDVLPGDLLMGDDSTPREVMSTCQGREMLYKITPTKGDPYVVNESHILSLIFSTNCSFKGKCYQKGDKIDLPLKEFIQLADWYFTRAGPLRGYRVPVRFPERKVKIDPWIIGHWLGDGHKNGVKFTTNDSEILDFYQNYFSQHGLLVKTCYDQRRDEHSQIDYTVTTGRLVDDKWTKNDNTKNFFFQTLKSYNLINNKHIPAEFKYNCREVQLKVIAGLIDSDGSLSNKGYDITQKNEQLIDDIIFISRSLGFSAYKSKCQKTCTNSTGKNAVLVNPDDKIGRVTKTYYRTNIHGAGLEEIPVKLATKKITEVRKQIKNPLVTKIKVEQVEVGDYYGFTLDGNGRFILGDFQVTHNTFLAIKLGATLKVKTIVVVNKEFLMKQWKTAIEKCSNASVGIIQRNKIDVEDKDIVIAMLHSLALKDYPEEIFDGFGYAVVDECHHISSESFSKALPKINCQYSLGLSATPIRRDGLTQVFLNYLGPIFHSEKRTNTNQVWIKFLEIKSDSENYNVEILECTGTKNTVKMINNIASFETLNFLIIEVCRILISNPDRPRKILVLGARREQLEWLNESWREMDYEKNDGKFATGGLYYGNQGMKKKDYWKMLEESADCDILWGTNDIAKEGLDIPDLNCLILLNGGTDVEQAVGRILRKYHEKTPPTVIDFVYKCGNFPNHARKRRDYYEQNDYLVHKLTVEINDNQDSVYLHTNQLEEFLEDYPCPGSSKLMKPLKKNKKVPEIPIGNHPAEQPNLGVSDYQANRSTEPSSRSNSVKPHNLLPVRAKTKQDEEDTFLIDDEELEQNPDDGRNLFLEYISSDEENDYPPPIYQAEDNRPSAPDSVSINFISPPEPTTRIIAPQPKSTQSIKQTITPTDLKCHTSQTPTKTRSISVTTIAPASPPTTRLKASSQASSEQQKPKLKVEKESISPPKRTMKITQAESKATRTFTTSTPEKKPQTISANSIKTSTTFKVSDSQKINLLIKSEKKIVLKSKQD